MSEDINAYLKAWNVIVKVLGGCGLDEYVSGQDEDVAKAYDDILSELRKHPGRLESEKRMRDMAIEQLKLRW